MGYLRYVDSLRLVLEGDTEGAAAGFAIAARVGDRFGSMELGALAEVGQGRCLIRCGDTAAGMALLDEAMSAMTTAEVSPTAMGDLYCTVIEGCQEVFDVGRAREWTRALTRWCDSQPELVLYHGQCLVHRAELMMLGGLWSEAVAEARRGLRRALPSSQPPRLGLRALRSGRTPSPEGGGRRGGGGVPAGGRLGTRATTRPGATAAWAGPDGRGLVGHAAGPCRGRG